MSGRYLQPEEVQGYVHEHSPLNRRAAEEGEHLAIVHLDSAVGGPNQSRRYDCREAAERVPGTPTAEGAIPKVI